MSYLGQTKRRRNEGGEEGNRNQYDHPPNTSSKFLFYIRNAYLIGLTFLFVLCFTFGLIFGQAIPAIPSSSSLRGAQQHDNSHVDFPHLAAMERRKNAELAAKVAELEQRHQADGRILDYLARRNAGNAAPAPLLPCQAPLSPMAL